jgi:hypothetical protein
MTEQEKLTLIRLLQEIFSTSQGEVEEKIFENVWTGYKQMMQADLYDEEMTEQELANLKEMFHWWFIGGFKVGGLLRGDK